MSNNTQPEIRFPGFTEDWEERKLNEGMTEYTDRVYIQDDEIYKQVSVKNVGEITLRGEQIGSKIGRKRQAKVNLIEHPDTLIFTRQTIEQGGIGFAPKETDGAIVTENMPTIDVDNDIINCNYLLAYVKTEDWYRKVILKNIEGGTAQIAIHEDSILSSEVLIPKIEEQQKIGTFFKQIDDTIALHQRKLDLLKETKKGFLQKMFPKNGAKVPEIRFPGFTEDWEERKLGDMMDVTSVKRIHQSDWTNSGIRFLRARDIVSAAKNEEPSDYLYISEEKYNEYSKISGKVSQGDLLVTGVGSIGVPLLITDDNPIYFKDGNIIWFKNEHKIDGNFFYYSFINNKIQKYIRDVAGIGTVGTYTIDSGKKTPISLPTYDEQIKIGSFFKQLDHTIMLHQHELDLLKETKKGFLQKMFV